jgi:acyl-CoA reductase-like NAD-dependent aldehyde dehydrogenase
MEKLSPILAFYVVDGLPACAKLSQQILGYGGMGHTAGIHTRSREAAVQFGADMPASRITVNTQPPWCDWFFNGFASFDDSGLRLVGRKRDLR